jgi:hypothetical protein
MSGRSVADFDLYLRQFLDVLRDSLKPQTCG